jgi:hypothetical protein
MCEKETWLENSQFLIDRNMWPVQLILVSDAPPSKKISRVENKLKRVSYFEKAIQRAKSLKLRVSCIAAVTSLPFYVKHQPSRNQLTQAINMYK